MQMYYMLCDEVPLLRGELQDQQQAFRYEDHWAAVGLNLRQRPDR